MRKRKEAGQELINFLSEATPEEVLTIWGAVYKGITLEEAQEVNNGLLAIVNYKGDSIEEIDRLCDEQDKIEFRLHEKYGGSVWDV